MKIKILTGEYIFNKRGTHVLDERGFAVKAQAEIEVEVSDDKADQIKALLVADRANRGLDAEGNTPEVVVEESKDSGIEESIFKELQP
jgi:hypothetical protein